MGIDGADVLQRVSGPERIFGFLEKPVGITGVPRELILLVQGRLVEDGDQVLCVPMQLDFAVDIDFRIRIGIRFQACVEHIIFRGCKVLYVRFLHGTRHGQQANQCLNKEKFFHKAQSL